MTPPATRCWQYGSRIGWVEPGVTGAYRSSLRLRPHEFNNNTIASVLVVPLVDPADVGITKVVDDDTPLAGQVIEYTLTVTNHGTANATGIIVLDKVDSNVSFISATPSQGSKDSASGKWTPDNLAHDSSATLVIQGKVAESAGGKTIVDQAAILRLNQTDPDSSNNVTAVTLNVVGGVLTSNVVIDILVDKPVVTSGENLTYTVRATNHSLFAVQNIVVNMSYPTIFCNMSAMRAVRTAPLMATGVFPDWSRMKASFSL